MKQLKSNDSSLIQAFSTLKHMVYLGRLRFVRLAKKLLRKAVPAKVLIVKVCSDPIEAGGVLLDSWVGESECQAPSIYGLSEPYVYKQSYGPLYFCKFENAQISPGSDIVRLDHICYWYKQRHPAFGNMIALDKDLIELNDGLITIRDNNTKPLQIRSAFSLLGVHDSVWAHFLVQYFPKLQYLHKAFEASPDTVVLVPSTLDSQAKVLLADFMSGMGLSDRLVYIDFQTPVRCEELFWVDHTSWLFDHSENISTLAIVVPKTVVQFIAARFDEIESIPLDDNNRCERIYLRRNGIRTTKNLDEIDKIMSLHGFKVIDPATLSLSQKKAVFSSAKVIVGQFGSAFTNILMCKPDTVVIALTNSDRLLDHYLPAMAFASKVRWIALAGVDCKPTGPHSDYIINPDQLSELLKDL